MKSPALLFGALLFRARQTMKRDRELLLVCHVLLPSDELQSGCLLFFVFAKVQVFNGF
jgi:hypothetical protein